MPVGSCNLLSGDLSRNGTDLFLVAQFLPPLETPFWRDVVEVGLQFHASLEVNVGVHATRP